MLPEIEEKKTESGERQGRIKAKVSYKIMKIVQ